MSFSELLLSIVLGLAINEMCDVSPFLATKILKWAARRIPGEGNAERYEEEWLALLQERPGKILKLAFASWLAVRSTYTMRAIYQPRGVRQRRARGLIDPIDVSVLSPIGFEELAAKLARRDGFRAVHVGGPGDRGVDVLATAPDGRTIGLQCKFRSSPSHTLASPLIADMSGVREINPRLDEVVVVTNGSFTPRAREFAEATRIHTIPGDVLQRWASGGLSLSEILGIAEAG